MGWNEVDDKIKKKIDSRFVSCSEKWEMDYLKKVIKEEFPYYSGEIIEKALKECCKEIPPPRPRTAFLKCLETKL